MAENDDRPVVLVYMCADERFDGPDGRMAELKQLHERRGYKVYFVRVEATANFLADPNECAHLLRMSRAFLLTAKMVVVEAHMTCLGLRDLYDQRGLALKDEDEKDVHLAHLETGVRRVLAELKRLKNYDAAVYAQLNLMTEIEPHGWSLVDTPAW